MRYLWIVAPHETDLFVYLSQRFAGRSHVEVILDRRHGQRRQHVASTPIERRQANRRQHSVQVDLDRLGVTIVRTPEWTPHPRPLGDPHSGVAALIIGRPTCRGCIAEQSSLTASDVAASLDVLSDALMVYREVDRCRVCGMIQDVFSVR